MPTRLIEHSLHNKIKFTAKDLIGSLKASNPRLRHLQIVRRSQRAKTLEKRKMILFGVLFYLKRPQRLRKVRITIFQTFLSMKRLSLQKTITKVWRLTLSEIIRGEKEIFVFHSRVCRKLIQIMKRWKQSFRAVNSLLIW